MKKEKSKAYARIAKYFFVFSFFVLIGVVPVGSKNADAHSVSFDPVDVVFDIWSQLETAAGTAYEGMSSYLQNAEWAKTLKDAILLPTLKMEIIKAVNSSVSSIVTGGDTGKPYLVTDWNQYLIKGPADDARVYVNSLLNDSMRGRSSSTDYSNSAYPAYLLKQAQQTIKKPEAINPTMVHSNDATGDLFAGGDMRAFNEFLSPGKNPYSYTLLAADAFNKKTEENRLIAEKEVVNGYKPVKDALGLIVTPAAFLENALNSASDMAREMVSNATTPEELVSTVFNYVISSVTTPLKEGLVGQQGSGNSTWVNPDTNKPMDTNATTSTWINPDTGKAM